MYLSASIFHSTFVSFSNTVVADASPHHDTEFAVRSPLHQIQYPFSTFPPYIHTLVLPSANYMNIILLHWYWVVHHLFSLHHANLFILLSNLTTTFFQHTLLENPWPLKRRLTVYLDTLTFLSSLNLAVISNDGALLSVFTIFSNCR
jgi:hypothetical protein